MNRRKRRAPVTRDSPSEKRIKLVDAKVRKRGNIASKQPQPKKSSGNTKIEKKTFIRNSGKQPGRPGRNLTPVEKRDPKYSFKPIEGNDGLAAFLQNYRKDQRVPTTFSVPEITALNHIKEMHNAKDISFMMPDNPEREDKLPRIQRWKNVDLRLKSKLLTFVLDKAEKSM